VLGIAFVRLTNLLRSSTFRLAVVYMALFAVSVLILLSFIYWSTAGYMARQADATIEAEIAGLAERYRTDGLTGLTAQIAARVSRKPGGSSIYLLADQFRNPLVGNLNRWPKVATSEGGWLNFPLDGAGPEPGGVHRARARPFRLQGGFHLLVGRDLHELEAAQNHIIKALVWGLAITAGLALVGGALMSRSMVRRIDVINQTSRQIMSGDLSRRIPTDHSGDDFDVLTGNLNAMLDQIESLMEEVRRVSDNIAHDLRTPLTRLRNSLELLRTEGLDAEGTRVRTDQAIIEAEGLLSTFNALLRIARIESGKLGAEFSEVKLASLVRDVVELYEPLAEEKGQRLSVAIECEASVRGDRDLVFQAFANLFDNAIKYTPAAGSIDARLEADRSRVCVTLSDSGPGVPSEAYERVFQRFYRLEESRSTPGNGLGLSLVAAVARLHQAEVTLADNQPGLRVQFVFPPRQQELSA
jgi:signal transduction histidine kinase